MADALVKRELLARADDRWRALWTEMLARPHARQASTTVNAWPEELAAVAAFAAACVDYELDPFLLAGPGRLSDLLSAVVRV